MLRRQTEIAVVQQRLQHGQSGLAVAVRAGAVLAVEPGAESQQALRRNRRGGAVHGLDGVGGIRVFFIGRLERGQAGGAGIPIGNAVEGGKRQIKIANGGGGLFQRRHGMGSVLRGAP